MARLIAENGPLDGESFAIDPGLTIGREKHNQVAMPANRRASRDHCKIWKDGPTTYAAADLGSTNGTLVNDQPITRAPLKDGDHVRVGDQLFRFELDESEKPRPKVAAPAAARPDLAAVLRGDAKPTPAGAPPGAGKGGDGAGSLEIQQRVLQYRKKSRGGTALGWDLSQMAGVWRYAMIAIVIGVAVGLFLLMKGLATGASTDERPSEEAPESP